MRYRRRFRIILVTILCLLFQHAALATYLCPTEPMPDKTMASTESCAGMGMAQKQDNPALCQKHCNPDHSFAPDTVKLSVPPLALPPLVLAPVYAQRVSRVALQTDVPISRSDPPPRLRFCSLLI
jgi:hypothetical protein